MKLDTLEKLFEEELADIYSAETQLIDALPKMAKTATSPELKRGFETHLRETRTQAERIEKILQDMDKKPGRKTCKGMEGLIEEGTEAIKSDGDPAVIDAALIAAAQRVEHYEIAAYGCARTYAEMLGNENAVRLLQQSLDEEAATDKKLTTIAESVVNVEAAQA